VTDTTSKTALRLAREAAGFSRERVAAKLEPPISSKTLERWEKLKTPVPRWQMRQLAALYEVDISSLNGEKAA
jgi:ribosome-binding protein aMBF1 (putative translation factor)